MKPLPGVSWLLFALATAALVVTGCTNPVDDTGGGNNDPVVSLPDSEVVPGNVAEIEIEGVTEGPFFAQIVSGPAIAIERVANANPNNSSLDYPGQNRELDFIFDYAGVRDAVLRDWLTLGTSATVTVTVRAADGLTIIYVWTLTDYRLASIETVSAGRKRYVLENAATAESLTGANSIADVQRSDSWGYDTARTDPAWPQLEIAGISTGWYPRVEVDESSKTITITASYQQGGQLFVWTRTVATGLADLRTISLVYRQWGGHQIEIGRNNFYEVFPIRYQHVSGFAPGSLGYEQVVLAYGFAHNTEGTSLPLYQPPTVEYHPGEGAVSIVRDARRNRVHMEIEGVLQTQGVASEYLPILIQGPGVQIDRDGVPGNRFSGLNREYPLVFDLRGDSLLLANLHQWRQVYLEWLPLFHEAKAMSLIVSDNGNFGSGSGGSEVYRFNLFEMIPYDFVNLRNGYYRVTLYHRLAPNNWMSVQWASSTGAWGNDPELINPDTDTRVEIDGVERAVRGRQRVVISYKTGPSRSAPRCSSARGAAQLSGLL